MTLFWKAESMRHGSELPKSRPSTRTPLSPLIGLQKMKVSAMISHIILYRLWRRGENFAAARRRSESLDKNADFGPREALNNVNNNKAWPTLNNVRRFREHSVNVRTGK